MPAPYRTPSSNRPCASALLVVLACALCACAPRMQQPSLRVMSYNIAAGNGDLARIADVIRSAAPDIVALQEVDVHWSARSGFTDQAALLGSLLGMHVRFGPIYSLPGAEGAPAREFGLAVLSRHPIVEFRNHEITRLSTQPGDSVPRPMPGFLEAMIRIGGANVTIFDTHLDYRADPAVRARQVSDMLALLTVRAGPAILLGDLNAPPDAAEIAPLLARLRDVWRGREGGHTYPAGVPVRRIDYILLSPHLAVRDARVIATAASDHRPVIADLLLRHER